MDEVAEYATSYGWKLMHVHRVKVRGGKAVTPYLYDGKGWFDLTIAREDGRWLFAELKVDNNDTSDEQDMWSSLAKAAGIPVYTWYPSDWEEIKSVIGIEVQSGGRKP